MRQTVTLRGAAGERLRAEDRTVIMDTHDSAIASGADLVLEMNDGRITGAG